MKMLFAAVHEFGDDPTRTLPQRSDCLGFYRAPSPTISKGAQIAG